MTYSQVKVSTKNGICLVKLNRPDIRNALVMEMREELIDLFTGMAADESVKVVILTGEGKAFSAGGDLRTLQNVTSEAGRKRLQIGHRLIESIMSLEKPVIAAVNGAAAGAGTSIALACDVILASDSAFFVQSFIKVGLVPDLGSAYLLPRLVGRQRALEMMLFGERITADQAKQMGLVNKVSEHKQLLTDAYEMAEKLAAGPGMAMGLTKKLVNRGMDGSLQELFALEGLAQGLCFESADFTEGVNAFFEKRDPAFTS